MFRDGTPPKLAAEIKAFVTQEVMHSREHVQFNKRALEAGYDMSRARGAGRMAAVDHPRAAADRQPRRDHVPRAFHRDPRPPVARQSAPPRPAPMPRARRCGAGTRSRRSSTRASPTTPGCTRPADWPRWQALEGQGEGDAVRHPQFRRRPQPRARSSCCARTGSPARAPGRGCSGSPGCGRACCARSSAPGSAFFLPGFHPWNQDDRALIARPSEAALSAAYCRARPVRLSATPSPPLSWREGSCLTPPSRSRSARHSASPPRSSANTRHGASAPRPAL